MDGNKDTHTHTHTHTHTQVANTQDIDTVMRMHNLIEYSNAYAESWGCPWQYYRDEPALDNNNNIIDFPDDNNNSNLFKYKQKITRQLGISGTKHVEIMVPLKYLSIFWRTVETPLINCKTNLQLKWSEFKLPKF